VGGGAAAPSAPGLYACVYVLLSASQFNWQTLFYLFEHSVTQP